MSLPILTGFFYALVSALSTIVAFYEAVQLK